jgi:ribosomal protein S18 acetylase RimI-like enzyme
MHRGAIWDACVAGFIGTPYKQTVGLRLACAPILGFRVTQPTLCDDYFVADCAPTHAMSCIHAVLPAPLCYITVCADDDHDIAQYQALGATYAYSELVMSVDVRTRPVAHPSHAVLRATHAEITQWNAMDPEGEPWLNSIDVVAPQMGHYAVFCADEMVARGRSLRMPSGYSYVSMVYVAPAQRRRGYGRALMQTMLNDDAAAGMHTSTLMASYEGAALYATLGYETVAQTHVFTL